MKKENSYTHIYKYTSLFGGVQGLNIIISLVRNKFVAILLGPAGVGLISVYNTASVLLQNATNFGIQISGVREISRAYDNGDPSLPDSIRLLRSWSLLVAMLGLVVTLLAAPLLSRWAFSSGEYTLEFMCLSPVVAMAAISGGETAVLKATRRLKQLAKISVLGMAGALVVSVPLYFKFGNGGIIPSILLIAIVQMALAMCCSYRQYPPSLGFGRELREGRTMLTVGAAFVLAGVFGSGAEFFIRAFLSDMSITLAGLYNAGYMITMTYAGMVFAAMETDYFPHLSAVCNDTRKMNGAVNRQIEVSMVMVAPLLVILMVGMPLVIQILFSSQFFPVIRMTQTAVIAMYFRAVNLPVAYIMLAKGDSRSYLCLELVYDILVVLTVILGYYNWGLDGTGAALAVTGFVDCVCVTSYCSWKYDFFLSNKSLSFVILQLFIGLLCLAVTFLSGVLYWVLGILLIFISGLLSIRRFRSCTNG